jgi:hypothetical protein
MGQFLEKKKAQFITVYMMIPHAAREENNDNDLSISTK